MPRRSRLVALVLLQAAVLGVGAGVAAAHEGAAPAPRPLAVPAPSLAPPPVVAPQPTRRAVTRPLPKAKPSPSPRATHRATRPTVHRTRTAPRPTTAPKPVVHRVPKPVVAVARTAQQRLMATVARIPGYRSGEADWIIRPGLGSWGLAIMGGATVYISPDVPADRLYDVVVHEWSHLLAVKAYGGEVMAAVAALNGYFGGADLAGAERAADCMARVLGATWTHYTPCTDAHWRDGARKLVARQRL